MARHRARWAFALAASLPLATVARTTGNYVEVSFPERFTWCAATSAHQVEGMNVHSDWWEWEHRGKIRTGEVSGKAADHWNRLEEDTDLLQQLNVGAYRFSVEWARIEPEPGRWDAGAIAHYRREIALLRERGIEPIVTLNHFTLPAWVARRGGWLWKGAPDAFATYVAKVYGELGEGIRRWITLNEPMVIIVLGYLEGRFPPGLRSPEKAMEAMLGLLRAHAAAYQLLHDAAQRAGVRVEVGLAHHLRVFDAKSPDNPLDVATRWMASEFFNWSFPRAVETGRLTTYLPPLHVVNRAVKGLRKTQDFVGVNYYTRDVVGVDLLLAYFRKQAGFQEKGGERTDSGWEIYPKGMHRILKEVSRRMRGRTILITENGIADATDSKRLPFLADHLKELSDAIREGVPVEGYCYWSLLDNFEWTEGFSQRFGLFEVDYGTFERRPRLSARWFARVALTDRFWWLNPAGRE
jgi:beta-glucosidase